MSLCPAPALHPSQKAPDVIASLKGLLLRLKRCKQAACCTPVLSERMGVKRWELDLYYGFAAILQGACARDKRAN